MAVGLLYLGMAHVDDFLTGPQSDESAPDLSDPMVRMLLGLHPDPNHEDVPDAMLGIDDEMPCETMNHHPDAVGDPWNDEDALVEWGTDWD